jgi:superfamily I DNA/RNA helicase/RecB family exonuclease
MSDSLNAAQRQAAEWSGGPLVVLAGPGTGKTRVIAHRIQHLIAQGSRPETIVAVTYTVKAAEQLRARLADLVGPSNADALRVHTFHGLGMNLLRRFGDVLGLPASPDLIDSAQTKRLLRRLVEDHRLFQDSIALGIDAAIKAASGVINALQDHAVEPADALLRARVWIDEANCLDDKSKDAELARAMTFLDQARLYEAFEKARRAHGWLAFGDLITLPIRLLRQTGRAAAICRDECRHFIVDEFQDSNPAQLALLKQLAPAADADVCVVGDDDQSIYAFRGADDRAFEHFVKVYPKAHEIRLTENYRSAPRIVAAANYTMSLASHRFAPDKRVESAGTHAHPGSVECVTIDENAQDAPAIAAMILADRVEYPDRRWRDIAVIAKTHAHLDHAAEAFELEGIPVRRQRARSPRNDQGVQDVLAWVQTLAKPDDVWSARRILLRPPYSLDPETVTAWERTYRAESRRAGAAARGFFAWLASQRAAAKAGPSSSAEGFADERLGKALDRHAELAALASTRGADEAIEAIVARTDAAHADLPAEAGGLARARRVADLVALIRFARERQPRLTPPGNLTGFLEYYADLDEKEQDFAPTGDERIDARAEGDDAADPPDAVTLLTAHSAKGLEFHTVFVMRVQPTAGGFGSAPKDQGVDLPPAILGRDDANDDDRAEQRRLFYVACTRAEERLVMLAKTSKSRSKSLHMFQEFTLEPEGRALVTLRTAAEVFEHAAAHGLSLRSAAGEASLSGSSADAADFAALLARARARARQAASLALEAADAPGLTPESLERITADLREAAGRLAVAADAARGVVTPWSAERDAWRADAQALAAGRAASLRGDFAFRVPGPRLDLSYSSIDHYAQCPRCWYVRHVMHVEESRDERLNTGGVVHRVLERFVTRRRDAEADGQLPPTEPLAEVMCREELAREAGPLGTVSDADLARTIALVRAAFAIERADPEPPNVLEIEKVIRFPYEHAGVRHTMTAKVDRIDQSHSGTLRIIDYKTGHASQRLLEPSKKDLQFGIYAMAVVSSFGGVAVPAGVAEYWCLSTGEKGTIAFAKLDLDAVRAQVGSMIEGVLAGKFPKHRKTCTGLCDILGLPHEWVGKGSPTDD